MCIEANDLISAFAVIEMIEGMYFEIAIEEGEDLMDVEETDPGTEDVITDMKCLGL